MYHEFPFTWERDTEAIYLYIDAPGAIGDSLQVALKPIENFDGKRTAVMVEWERPIIKRGDGPKPNQRYEGAVQVHAKIDATLATADYENGVVTVRLPFAADAAKPVTLTVRCKTP